jgi:hypothetical protein
MYMLYTNIMEFYFQLKHASSNFESGYIHVWTTCTLYTCTIVHEDDQIYLNIWI